MQTIQKTGLYILSIIGFSIIVIGTPLAAYFVPQSHDTLTSFLMTVFASLGVIMLFFTGAFLIGYVAPKLTLIESKELK